MREHFETLGLSEGASKDEIQRAYDRLSVELNPENHESKEFFKEEFEKVKKAYNALMANSTILKNDSPRIETNSSAGDSPKDLNESNQSGSVTFTISREKIEEMKNRKQNNISGENKVSEALRIISILSMAGSGGFILIFFIFFVKFDSLLGFMIFLIFGGAFSLKFLGAWRMYRREKRGYLIYMVPSIILNALFIFSIISGNQRDVLFAVIVTIVMILFSFLFHKYKVELVVES